MSQASPRPRDRSASGAPPTVETRQLLLRATRPDDADALYAIQGDREAMVHTWWAPDRDATADWLRGYAQRLHLDGFGPWTAVLRSSGAVVGWGGLNVDPADPRWGPELAYFVHRDHWGRGLATEIAEAALAWGFGELWLPEVAAFALRENAASQRVLAKCGFRLTGFVHALDRNRYVASHDTWRRRREPRRVR